MDLPKLASVFGLAFFSFWASIPAGFALGLQPVVVGFTAWLSYVAGVVIVALLGEPIRQRIMARFGGKAASNPNSPIRRAWNRFGLIGLSLLAPITTGSQIATVIGLSLGVPPRRLVVGMALGAATWGMLLTAAVALGLMAVSAR
jgi:hypothetical protein